MKPTWPVVAVVLSFGRPGAAQQFQQVGTGLPGPVVWTEGVEAFDANGDGRPDVLFANGIGFSSAGGALAPTLLVNQTSPGGPITFADETAARLPSGFVQQGKGLVVADVDGDGDLDVAFANGFGRQPSLLINDGAGVFTNQTATRFPTLTLNSFGGGFGDVDDDGDLDLVFADAGPSAFGGPGGLARLFLNDGTGVFADSPLRMNAANKVGAQNAQLADVDNDFDLDVIVDGKSAGQQLYLNDGTGTFALQPGVLPAGTSNTYATDFADLDNDDDLDAVYISLGGFNEGTARNGLVPSGSLGFTATQGTLTGPTDLDDNDVVFLDADDDGLLDVLVGSLDNDREILYRNAGTFANGSFVYQPTGFSGVTDSTLDLATADFDGDGRYDVVTGQGESGNFTNRVYRNTGPADTRAPRIGRVQPTPARVPLSTLLAGGFARRAWIQDATYKRGQTFVRARADLTMIKDGHQQSASLPMRNVGGGLFRAVLQPPASLTGRVGMDVTWSVHASDPANHASDSAPATFRVCGAEAYGVGAPNSTGQPAQLAGIGDPGLAANTFGVSLAGLPAAQSGLLVAGTVKISPWARWHNGVPQYAGGTVQTVAPVAADASGQAVVALDFTQPPFGAAAPGTFVYLEFRYQEGVRPNATNGLELVFCD